MSSIPLPSDPPQQQQHALPNSCGANHGGDENVNNNENQTISTQSQPQSQPQKGQGKSQNNMNNNGGNDTAIQYPSAPLSNEPKIDDNDDCDTNMNQNQQSQQQEKQEDKEQNERPTSPPPLILGGTIDKPAYALLTGQYEDIKDYSKSKIQVPIYVLPAILGRTQTTSDEHIFDLGNCKALSRKHAVIFYSDCYGGQLGMYDGEYKNENVQKVQIASNSVDENDENTKNENDTTGVTNIDNDIVNKWRYKKQDKDGKRIQEDDIIRPTGVSLPSTGFFAIQCISKNKLFVDKLRVEQGQIAMLSHGSTIRMAGYMLYFILPDVNNKPIQTISVIHPTENKEEEYFIEDDHPSHKKIKLENYVSSPTSKGGGGNNSSDQFEGKPLKELLHDFIKAVDDDVLERKHSLMSGVIMSHAIQDVAKNKELQTLSKTENGVSRAKIMKWIEQNKVYSTWVEKVLTTLEMKSYQSNMSKALIKAGFTRLGTTGRHVKWLFPPMKTVKKAKKEEHDNEEQQDDVNDTEKDGGNDVDNDEEMEDGDEE